MTEDATKRAGSGGKVVYVGKGFLFKPLEAGKAPYLIGAKCDKCGYVSFPKTVACPNCQSLEPWHELALARQGRLVAYAVSQQAPVGFSAPYIQANIQLDDGPVVFSLVTGCEPREGVLELGQKMELVIEKVSTNDNGDEVIGWKFKPSPAGK